MVNQSMALTKISTSTWGATFSKARQIYTTVVRPAMTYGSPVLYTPKNTKKSSSTEKLAVLQSKCLRTIAGAFKATPIPVLEAETFITPIDIHLDQLQAKARYRLHIGGQSKFIARACKVIANKLRGKAGRKRVQEPTPGVLKHNWARNLLANAPIVLFPDPPPPWFETLSTYSDKLGSAVTSQRNTYSRQKRSI